MVRNYQRKRDREATTPRKLAAAVQMVEAGMSIRKAGQLKSVNRETLRKAVKKTKDSKESNSPPPLPLTFKTREVFPPALDSELGDYCAQLALSGHGLSTLLVRALAYDLVVANPSIKAPQTWLDNKLAGLEWLHGKLSLFQ